MICAVYARFARDEEHTYKESVYNELLRTLGYRIPMLINPLIALVIKNAVDSADFKSGMTARQAAERIKRELIMKDIALKATQPVEGLIPSAFSRIKQYSGTSIGAI